MEEYSDYAKVFKALGEPKRIMILDMLSNGELCACMILQEFEMSQSTLSHHMKLLCKSGLVNSREEGKWTYYSLNPEAIEKIKQFFNTVTSVKAGHIHAENPSCCKGKNENEG